MNEKRQEIVRVARSFLGVPFLHQGANRAGMDCRGLLMTVYAHDLKLVDYDVSDPDYFIYARDPDKDKFRTLLDRHFERIDPSEAREGDVLVMQFKTEPQHTAIVTDTSRQPMRIIHASSKYGRVVEHDLDAFWSKVVVGGYRLPGIE